MRNLGILFAELEKTFTRATSRAQRDGINCKTLEKVLLHIVPVLVMICALAKRTCLANTF